MRLIDATFDNYIQSINDVKKQSRKIISNCFLSVDKIKDLLEAKGCMLYIDDAYVFLAVPEHEMFYRLYYHTTDLSMLSKSLSVIALKLPMVCTISGAEKDVDLYKPCFEQSGFTLRRRMRRFAYLRSEKNDFSGYEGNSHAVFASPNDAEEIYNILTSHFDVYTQAVPEMSKILENINKNQVSVIKKMVMPLSEESVAGLCPAERWEFVGRTPIEKKDSKIAALLYYELHGSTLHSIFEVVLEEYRGEMLNVELMAHRDEHLKNQKIKLMYGWRDMDNERLIKLGEFYAKRWGTRPGNTVIYTFFCNRTHHI